MTPRIPALSPDTAPADSAQILRGVEAAIGRIPNLHRTLAHAPAALRAYTDATRSLATGTLDPRLREQLAVTLAGANRCAYCAAAHTTIGKALDLEPAELTRNLAGESDDGRTAAVLRFALALLDRRGDVDEADLRSVRDAGLGDAEIVEIVAHVALNTFTNTFNVFARTEIDFPRVALPGASA